MREGRGQAHGELSLSGGSATDGNPDSQEWHGGKLKSGGGEGGGTVRGRHREGIPALGLKGYVVF